MDETQHWSGPTNIEIETIACLYTQTLFWRLLFTKVGEFWSGQKDSGIGQWPTGTPVLGLGRM